MSEAVRKLLGEGPYIFPVDNVEASNEVEAYLGAGIIILSTTKNVDFSVKGYHAHESYEFLVPFSSMPPLDLEGKLVSFEKNRVFPFNSWSVHGPAEERDSCRLMGIQIDKQLVSQISYMLCGKKKVEFRSENTPFSQELRDLTSLFMFEAKNLQTGSSFILENLANMITVNLLRQIKSNIPVLITERNYAEKEHINRAVCFLRDNYNIEYSLEHVANIAGLSQYHFIKVFKAETGKTPYDYVLDIKVEKAIEHLKQKKYSITEICFICGFNNLNHFASVFKRKVGVLPSEYRKMNS
jgi:AraC-type DNA-binding domain-containing proteins